MDIGAIGTGITKGRKFNVNALFNRLVYYCYYAFHYSLGWIYRTLQKGEMIVHSGTHVKKETHQKALEQNKKLLADLWLLTMRPLTEEKFKVMMAYRKKFAKEKNLNKLLKDFVTKNYFP
jgi:hypothetical protein